MSSEQLSANERRTRVHGAEDTSASMARRTRATFRRKKFSTHCPLLARGCILHGAEKPHCPLVRKEVVLDSTSYARTILTRIMPSDNPPPMRLPSAEDLGLVHLSPLEPMASVLTSPTSCGRSGSSAVSSTSTGSAPADNLHYVSAASSAASSVVGSSQHSTAAQQHVGAYHQSAKVGSSAASSTTLHYAASSVVGSSSQHSSTAAQQHVGPYHQNQSGKVGPYHPSAKVGRLEVILGPMFSGKTTELLRRLRRARHARKRILVAKFAEEATRGSLLNDCLATHDEQLSLARPVRLLGEIVAEMKHFDILGVDEAQFFDDLVGVAAMSSVAMSSVSDPSNPGSVGSTP